MWNITSVTQTLGINYPIIQGPFGGRYSSAKLVAAVSNAGGLGSFGLHAYPPEEILKIGAEIRSLTTKPFALNLWVPLKDDPAHSYSTEDFNNLKEHFSPLFNQLQLPVPEAPQVQVLDFEQQLEAVLQVRPAVASFIFGVPSREAIKELKQAGIRLIGTATTAEEAALVEEAGLDMVVASGAEAGGHRASFLASAEDSLTSTAALIPQVLRRVKIPVIAAGGISDGRAVHAALQMGASAVQIGTSFLATEESNASSMHKQKLLQPDIETTLTKVYTGRLARAIANTFLAIFKNCSQEAIAPYPIQSKFLSPLMKAYAEKNKWEYIAFWSGQPSSALKHTSAIALFNALCSEVEKVATEA